MNKTQCYRLLCKQKNKMLLTKCNWTIEQTKCYRYIYKQTTKQNNITDNYVSKQKNKQNVTSYYVNIRTGNVNDNYASKQKKKKKTKRNYSLHNETKHSDVYLHYH